MRCMALDTANLIPPWSACSQLQVVTEDDLKAKAFEKDMRENLDYTQGGHVLSNSKKLASKAHRLVEEGPQNALRFSESKMVRQEAPLQGHMHIPPQLGCQQLILCFLTGDSGAFGGMPQEAPEDPHRAAWRSAIWTHAVACSLHSLRLDDAVFAGKGAANAQQMLENKRRDIEAQLRSHILHA